MRADGMGSCSGAWRHLKRSWLQRPTSSRLRSPGSPSLLVYGTPTELFFCWTDRAGVTKGICATFAMFYCGLITCLGAWEDCSEDSRRTREDLVGDMEACAVLLRDKVLPPHSCIASGLASHLHSFWPEFPLPRNCCAFDRTEGCLLQTARQTLSATAKTNSVGVFCKECTAHSQWY